MFFINFFCLIVHFEEISIDRKAILVKNINIKKD